MNLLNLKEVENVIITIRNKQVILDCDVAVLYGVETRDINKAVKNNPDKFPKDYVLNVDKIKLVENFHRFNKLKHSTAIPKAFTEKGLYMLATILKSPKAIQTTITIIETFAKLHELSQTLVNIQNTTDEVVHQSLLKKSGSIMNDLLFKKLTKSSAETSVEFNLGLMKVKHSVKSDNTIKIEDITEIKTLLKDLSKKIENKK